MKFVLTRQSRILTLVLLAQAAGFYALSHGENVPLPRPLKDFPGRIGDWAMVQEGVIEKEEMEVLRADDVLTRSYAPDSGSVNVSLFVAYFKSQRTGQTPHSPRNCLPGNGWTPAESSVIPLVVPGEPRAVLVNRYLVSKGSQKSVVFYWYQTSRRVVASEYAAKFYSMADSIRYHRTDTALVRVVVPATGGAERAESTGVAFIKAFFEPLRRYLPS